MAVTPFHEMASDPRKAQAAVRNATVNRLVTAKRQRAAAITAIDGRVNQVFASFTAPGAKFTRASIAKISTSLNKLGRHLAAHRRAALSDLHASIQAGIPNKAIVAQLGDLHALTAKVASLRVTAAASVAADGEELSDQDLVNIDGNGYVAPDAGEPTEDDLSVATGEGEDPGLDAGDPPAIDEMLDADTEVPAAPAAAAKAAKKRADVQGYPDEPELVDTAEDAVTAARAAAKKAGFRKAEVVDPNAPQIQDQRSADPNDPEDHGNDPLDGEAKGPLVASAKTAKKAPAKASSRKAEDMRAGDPNDPEDHANDPLDGEAKGPLVAKKADVQGYPDEPQEVDTPEEAVTAADGEDELENTDDAGDGDVENLELELQDPGLDALTAEILGDDFPADEPAEDELNGDDTVSAKASVRGGKAAQRATKLASARRTDPRATDDATLKSMISELMA